MPNESSNAITQSRKLSIQSQTADSIGGGAVPVVWLARAGLQVSPWWSPARDVQLRKFWKKPDHLSGAIYTLEAKMTAIPFKILARDPAIREHVVQAEETTRLLRETAQFGNGWIDFLSRWLEDYLTQDNGAFAEIIGRGRKDGPLIGQPVTIAHLDSGRCTRTGNDEFPVIYENMDGVRYKLHYTRVLFKAQMSSPIKEMFGVGLCGVSRCINVAQTLLDVLLFKQEKMGSRPHRAVITTRGGLDPDDVHAAFQLAESGLDDQGLSRYSKVVVTGSSALPEAGLDMHELSSLPDGFDEETSTTLGMAAVALAFGVDARELFPAMTAGATRADALLQHLKQRGKGPGQIIETIEQQFNHKYLPQHLEMVFDYQDDAQDRQEAEIRKIRAEKRVQDLASGALNVRIVREQMLEDDELTRSQFERLELTDGRLANGTSVLALFFSTHRVHKRFLDMGADDPLDIEANNTEAMFTLIDEKVAEVNTALVNSINEEFNYRAFQSLMALIFLRKHYQNPESSINAMVGEKPEISPLEIDGRVRTSGDASVENSADKKPEGKTPITKVESTDDRME